MKQKKYLNSLSHHAYCLIGQDSEREALKSELESVHKYRTASNADFIERQYQTFTIDDARDIKSLAETKPVSADGKKIFILQTNGITVEAQNALLKLLEEPGERTHFFLILPSAHLLLPTVRSRLSFLGENGIKNMKSNVIDPNEEADILANKFMKAQKKDRFDMVKNLVDDISKEKKTRQDALDFLDAIETNLYASGAKNNLKSLEGILLVRRYINDRSPSMKMLLDYVGTVI